MVERVAAEGFLPGEFISDELEERGWSQADLADIIGKTPPLVNDIIRGKRKVTPEIAEGLSAAFGTSAEYWTNLETAYQYWLLRRGRAQVPVSQRKARLMAIAPYRELIRRGWIEASRDIDVLEVNVLRFLGMNSLDDTLTEIRHAARKSASYAEVSPALRAYLAKARHIARGLSAKPFSVKGLRSALPKLKALSANAEDVRLVSRVLADAGVRLVVVEHLSGTRVDGATLWLSDGSPVAVLSLRYDRIDSLWHTLMHEIGHILNGDGEIVDSGLVGEDAAASDQKPESENRADEFAVEFLVPQLELHTFIHNHRPLYYARDIQGFARVHRVHPGIIVGQMHHLGELKYYQFRGFLAKTRSIITDSTLTDGWGAVIAGV